MFHFLMMMLLPQTHAHIEVKTAFGLIRIHNRIAGSRGQRVRYEPNWWLRFSSHVASLVVKCRWAPGASTQVYEDCVFSVLMRWQALRLDQNSVLIFQKIRKRPQAVTMEST